MAVMTFQGSVQNGRVRLEPNIVLPENAKVFVVVPEFDADASKPRFDLAEMLSRVPSDYQVQEEDFGKPVGREVW